MKIDNKFQIGDFVYLKTDPQQYKRIVVGIIIMNTNFKYVVNLSVEESMHFECELDSQRDIVLATSN